MRVAINMPLIHCVISGILGKATKIGGDPGITRSVLQKIQVRPVSC